MHSRRRCDQMKVFIRKLFFRSIGPAVEHQRFHNCLEPVALTCLTCDIFRVETDIGQLIAIQMK